MSNVKCRSNESEDINQGCRKLINCLSKRVMTGLSTFVNTANVDCQVTSTRSKGSKGKGNTEERRRKSCKNTSRNLMKKHNSHKTCLTISIESSISLKAYEENENFGKRILL